ncbi:MAG TPA: recombinase family protein, partial [Phycisphaerae bacterium]|nr:recombinase family protein [Phycisphaerae bacterium]
MTTKNSYLALARVSSREQEREGFSLDVQEDALRRYAERHGGEIVKFYRIAETASKQAERKTFKELLEYAKKNAHKLDGLLFYKVDRAARNLFDYVELERLEMKYNLPIVYVAQPTENTPAGRMQRRILANMASFYTEQQSLDVREGQSRRAESGLFPCKAPYGYRNNRVDGRSLVEIDTDAAANVRRIFELYSQHGQTLDGVVQAMAADGRTYTSTQPQFTRSKVHHILRDRSYIGEVLYRGQWLAGKHSPLIGREVFDRVQVLLGDKTYASHDSVYGSGMVKCGHCGRPMVYEVKTKSTSSGPKEYRYYRCSRYTSAGHPRVRINETQLDKQIIEFFRQMKVSDPKIHAWMVKIIQLKAETFQRDDEKRLDDLQRQMAVANRQRSKLLNMRIAEEIDRDTFAAKDAELRDQMQHLSVLIDAHSREKSEYADIAIKAFELSQQLENKWLTGDVAAKREILNILCLNYTLNDVSLDMEIRKPFDVLAK